VEEDILYSKSNKMHPKCGTAGIAGGEGDEPSRRGKAEHSCVPEFKVYR